MKTINLIRRVISYPFRLMLIPLGLIVLFFMTDFENEWDLKFFKNCMMSLIKL